jgi:hypothetical protein
MKVEADTIRRLAKGLLVVSCGLLVLSVVFHAYAVEGRVPYQLRHPEFNEQLPTPITVFVIIGLLAVRLLLREGTRSDLGRIRSRRLRFLAWTAVGTAWLLTAAGLGFAAMILEMIWPVNMFAN